MKYLEYIVKNMKISKSQTDKAVLISGATDYFGLHFTYDEEFASLEEVKTCEFFKNRKTVKVDLVDGYCAIPNEILRDKNPFEMRVVSGNTIGTPWVAITITEGGIIDNDDEPEELAPMGTAYVKTLTGENNISMIRDNDGGFEYSKDGTKWKKINTNDASSEIDSYELDTISRQISQIHTSNKFEWKDFDKSYFAFVIDDCNNTLPAVYDLFHSKGIPLSSATIVDNLDMKYSGETRSVKDVLELIVADGGEVLAHYTGNLAEEGYSDGTHEFLTSKSDWLAKTRDVKKTLEEHGFEIRGIIRADYTVQNTQTGEDICRRYFDYSDGLGISPQYNLKRTFFHSYSNIEALKSNIDMQASKPGFYPYCLHGTETLASIENLTEILDYIMSKGDAVAFTTYAETYDTFGTTVMAKKITDLGEKESELNEAIIELKNSMSEEIILSNMAEFYDTSTFSGDTFILAPESESFITSNGNFLKWDNVGWSTPSKYLAEGEPVTFCGVETTLNADGSITLNGTSTNSFYVNTNINSNFRNAIIGKNAKVSFSASENINAPLNTGIAFNDVSYGYNAIKTGSFSGLVTGEKMAGNIRLNISNATTFNNVTISAMLEIASEQGYLQGNEKSDCKIISESTECAISDYPYFYVVGKHTIEYTSKNGNGVNPEDIEHIKMANPLFGKKVSCIGDSLCYGQGFAGGYCTVLSELEPDATFVNKGLGGSQISSNHENGDNWWIANQLSGIAEDTDYIICEGYVNDYLTGCELGEISDGYETELDTTKFYGGMESLCKKLANDYTDKRYGFVITHSHHVSDAAYNNNLYIEAIKECCDKWGVPYLDLSSVITPIVPIYKSTYYSDGLHYNEAGYRRITPAIREWIKTL